MIRYLIEAEENFNPIPVDTTEARKAVFEHFNVSCTCWKEVEHVWKDVAHDTHAFPFSRLSIAWNY